MTHVMNESLEKISDDLWGLAIDFLANVNLADAMKSDGTDWRVKFDEVLDRQEDLLRCRFKAKERRLEARASELEERNRALREEIARRKGCSVHDAHMVEVKPGDVVVGMKDGREWLVKGILPESPYPLLCESNGESKTLRAAWVERKPR